MSRLKDLYKDEIVDAMIKKFGYKNIMEVPKLDKIVINMGVGEAKENAKVLDSAVKDLETITGQKVVLTRAKNSVANFKIREGMPIGCKTTLRGEKMYDFMDRLVNQTIHEVIHFLAAKCCLASDRHTLTDFEVSNGIFRSGKNNLLSSNCLKILYCGIQNLGILFCFTNTHVDDDLVKLRNFHNVFIAELLDHSIYDLVFI